MGKIYSVLITLYLPTSVCILSTLFSIHFPWCWHWDLIKRSRASLVGDHFIYSHNLNVWFKGDDVRNKMPITVRGWRVVRCFITVPKVYDYHLAIGKVSLNSNWILFFWGSRRKVNYMICTSSLFNSKRPFKISEKPTLQGNSIHVNTYLKHPKDHVLYI